TFKILGRTVLWPQKAIGGPSPQKIFLLLQPFPTEAIDSRLWTAPLVSAPRVSTRLHQTVLRGQSGPAHCPQNKKPPAALVDTGGIEESELRLIPGGLNPGFCTLPNET